MREGRAGHRKPRDGNRVTQFLAEDQIMNLITQANRPVIALPRAGTD